MFSSLLKKSAPQSDFHIPEGFQAFFDGLNKHSVVIDCGANVGKVSHYLASTGAQVHAFEPNPYAFAKLHDRLERYRNVHLYPAAAADHEGEMKLYLHEQNELDPVKYSTGSSLLEQKNNISSNSYELVRVVDIADFIQKLGMRIHLMKIDVEGAEISIVNRLLESGQIDMIDRLLVERHDAKNPHLHEATEDIIRKVKQANLPMVSFDWI